MPAAHSRIVKAATAKPKERLLRWSGELSTSTYTSMGQPFQVTTDHKPLETIFNNPTCKATARVERLQLRLQPYKTKVVYKPGANNPADYMSRHPDPKH